ncbi:hypothetical protein EMIHUDRAFT_309997 [Emiliania huxleyi CCMP1516]|uniref:Uncharacterized protein n=2 Tax=Emiliania huxleyi TaxID=2903 RepID=A0A0D3JUC7_EMIH1|nr:hypothetical protein EMIHUDRAFT_309997 [Emiliania huxleyi CCMP1516]EOD27112.1 hypothetical protein EMIHUDRAFT_309997 [Emiliania huxleyi CCMP1516]|eukprot:XP_005779541.1 hypothetical protein EMIHUDRAFT_309997 [Emiliania huxleyi CCMP1516]
MPASGLFLVCPGAATFYKRHPPGRRRRALSGASCCPFPAKARRGPSTPRVSEVSVTPPPDLGLEHRPKTSEL